MALMQKLKAEKNMTRKNVSAENETEILLKSSRRCALCFGLNGDFQIKKGQIAHIDKDNRNSNIENLVFLCLQHHDEYDSITSQSKNLKNKELTAHRDDLYEFVSRFTNASRIKPPQKEFLTNKSENKFQVYRLVNSGSICGYKFLAVNETKKILLSISEGHVSLALTNSEFIRWLNCDYVRTPLTFEYSLTGLNVFVFDNFHEYDYALTVFLAGPSIIKSVDLAFGYGIDNYYELEFKVEKKNLIKKAISNDEYFARTIDLKEKTDGDVVLFEELKNYLQKIIELKVGLFKQK